VGEVKRQCPRFAQGQLAVGEGEGLLGHHRRLALVALGDAGAVEDLHQLGLLLSGVSEVDAPALRRESSILVELRSPACFVEVPRDEQHVVADGLSL
jgi:hypothetical protein